MYVRVLLWAVSIEDRRGKPVRGQVRDCSGGDRGVEGVLGMVRAIEMLLGH